MTIQDAAREYRTDLATLRQNNGLGEESTSGLFKGEVAWLIDEVERWKQEALSRRERKILCEQLQAEVDRLREGIRLQELLDGTGEVAP